MRHTKDKGEKRMNKKSVAIGMSAVLLAASFGGCAKKATEVQAAYVPKSKYIDKDCRLLEKDMENVSYKLVDLTKSQDSAHNRDVAMVVVGTVLFWPAYFVMLAGDKEEELAKLKGEYQAIDEALVYNHCYAKGESGVDYIKKAQEKLQAANEKEKQKRDTENDESPEAI
jgi:hypothetical protein